MNEAFKPDPEKAREILEDMVKLRALMRRELVESITENPALSARMRSIMPKALRLVLAAKQVVLGKTHVFFEVETRDGRRATYLPITLVQWYGRTVHFGDPCKAAIREAKRTLYAPHRGTWAERTRGADTWAHVEEVADDGNGGLRP